MGLAKGKKALREAKSLKVNVKSQLFAERLAEGILAVQLRLALWLNSRAAKWKRVYLVVLLLVIWFCFGLWCLVLVLLPLWK